MCILDVKVYTKSGMVINAEMQRDSVKAKRPNGKRAIRKSWKLPGN
ncbi:hypothetical protein LQZ21_11905 [Treponema sp. TIM-1]